MKVLFLFLISVSFLACSLPKNPELKTISDIKITKTQLDNVTIVADAVFENANHVAGELEIEDVHIAVNRKDIGTVFSKKIKVPARSEFSVPLEGQFSLAKIFPEHRGDLLAILENIIRIDSLEIQYKGNLNYYFGDFSYTYPIEKSQFITLKR